MVRGALTSLHNPFSKYIKLNNQAVNLEDVRLFVDENKLDNINIQLQSAPLSEVGMNGIQIGDVIELITEIIKSFNDKCPCRENSLVITKLQEAKMWNDQRTVDRVKRKVEGTDKQ